MLIAAGAVRWLFARTILIAGLVALGVSVVAGVKCRDCMEPECKNNSVCDGPFCTYIEKNDTDSIHTISYRCTLYDDLQYPGLGDGPPNHLGKCIKNVHRGIEFAMKICNDTDLCNTIGCALVEPDDSGSSDANNTAAAGPTVFYGAAAVALLSLLAVA